MVAAETEFGADGASARIGERLTKFVHTHCVRDVYALCTSKMQVSMQMLTRAGGT